MADKEDEKYVSRGKKGPQVRKRRKDGWTKHARCIFLDHFRATCNATASAKAAGLTEGSAFKLRARDLEFAAEWDLALRDSDARLTGKLIVFAETKGKKQPEPDEDEPAVAPIEDFDPQLALAVIRHHQASLAGGRRRGGPRPKAATRDELIEALVKQLAALRRREAKRVGK